MELYFNSKKVCLNLHAYFVLSASNLDTCICEKKPYCCNSCTIKLIKENNFDELLQLIILWTIVILSRLSGYPTKIVPDRGSTKIVPARRPSPSAETDLD